MADYPSGAQVSGRLTPTPPPSIIQTLDTFYSDIGRRLRAARSRAGISQETLALQVGLRRTSIANIERGAQRVQIHTLYALAEATACDVRDLLPAVENPDAPAVSDLLRSLTTKDRETVEGLAPADRQTLERAVAGNA